MSTVVNDNFVRSNIYNKYSPFNESIKKQSDLLFDEILKNLSLTIQLDELEPGFSVWSKKLKEFISLYGFSFSKIDHIKLINYYLSILSINNLNYQYVKICFDLLHELLRFVFFFIIRDNFLFLERLI